MSNVVELFGKATDKAGVNWNQVIEGQACVFANKRCYKVRRCENLPPALAHKYQVNRERIHRVPPFV